MQRLLIALAMVLMLGAGLLAGSLLTPSAKAQKATAVDAQIDPYPNQTYTPPSLPSTGYTYVYPPRWQIIPVLEPDARDRRLTLLIDTMTGNTYFLQYNTGNYFWAPIGR